MARTAIHLIANLAAATAASTLQKARRLDVALDGSYNIRFSQCVDVKLKDDDLFADEVVDYVKDGEIVSTKSYVLFHLCQAEDCFYEAETDLYMIDLRTYLTNVATFHATKKSTYCEACDGFANYCLAGDDAVAGDDGAQDEEQEEEMVDDQVENNQAAAEEQVENQEAAEEEQEDQAEANDEQRKLKKQRRTNTVIDCDQCSALSCFDQSDDDAQDNLDAQVADLIGDLAGCLATGQYWNGEQLYLSTICSSYGDGVELAVFLDNECTVYTNKATFQAVYQNYIYESGMQDLSTYVETYIKSSFDEDMSCQDVEYVHPDEATDDENYDEVQEYCQQIFAEGAVDFSQCYSQDYAFGSNSNDDDQYSWYTYDMTYDEANDIEDVCTVIYQMSGEYSHSYDEERSGTWYSRDRSGSIKSNKSSRGVEFSPIAITLLVLLGVGIVGVSAFISYRKRQARRMEPLYAGGAMI